MNFEDLINVNGTGASGIATNVANMVLMLTEEYEACIAPGTSTLARQTMMLDFHRTMLALAYK